MPIAFGERQHPVWDALRVQTLQGLPTSDQISGAAAISGLGNSIIVYHSSGADLELFDPTQAGLILALAAAVSGDTVWLPSMTIAITAALTIPADIALVGITEKSRISGATVILSAGVFLERTTIINSQNDASDHVAIQGPATGLAYIGHCTLTCINAGSGGASAINGGAGALYVHDSTLTGTASSGAGYGVFAGAGNITLDDCWVLGSTSPLFGTGGGGGGTVYTAGAEISTGAITVNSGAGDAISGLSIASWYAVECFGGPFNANPADPRDSYHYTVSNDGGSVWSGLLGNTGISMQLIAPTWGVNPVDLDGLHARFFFQATTTSILIRTGDFYWVDNTGTLSWRLRAATATTGGGTIANIYTHGVRMAIVSGDPQLGDRSVWDVLNHGDRHANDIALDTPLYHLPTATADGQVPIWDAASGEWLPSSSITNPVPAAPEGWLTPWQYRYLVTIANSGSLHTNYKVAIDVNTLPLVEAGLCNPDLSDLRVTAADGVSLLPFFRANDALLFNESNFSRYASNPILVSGGGGAWDNGWVHPNSLIDMGNGTYRLYYSANNTPGDSNTPDHIGYATSTDGIAWTKYVSNPIVSPGAGGAWDDTKVDHFCVIRESASVWKAWYMGSNGSLLRIGYATSSDGITWSKSGSNPVLSSTAATWDSAFVVPSKVLFISGTYYLFYWGGTSTGTQTTWKIGLATSTDGITWTKSGNNPILSGAGSGDWDAGVLDVDVVHIGNTFFMFYQGNVSSGNNSAIGIATSTDLINWTRYSTNPFPRGGGGSWDSDWNEGPTLARIGTQWMMYYMGKGSTTTKSIGLMEFPDTRLWPVIPTVPAAGSVDVFVYYGNPAAADASTGSAGSPDGNITTTNGTQSTPALAAWDDEAQPGAHAKDIDDASYTLHLNPALNPDVGTFGDASNIPQITVDARGLITAIVNVPVSIPAPVINTYNEEITATGATTYYLANYAVPGSLRVYINGILQPVTDDTVPSDVVTFATPPAPGALITFAYDVEIV